MSTARSYLHRIVTREHLAQSEARDLMNEILAGNVPEIELAALLSSLRTKCETREELCGFLEAMRAHMLAVISPDPNAIDLCGTGGDGSHSFNLSSAAALVAAAGGVTVAKHGNRAVSSQSGSADFFEALHIPFASDPETAAKQLAHRHFAFLFAPHFHPAMKVVAPVRKQLAMRTVFNLLGPLANPARVTRQLVGVFSADWLHPVVETLAATGTTRALVVHSKSGLDEICAEDVTVVCELRDGDFTEYVLTPARLGIAKSSRDAVSGGSAAENAQRFVSMSRGQEPALQEWVIANAAPAFYLADKAGDIKAGATQAREVIQSGRLREFMDQLCS